MDNPEKFLDAHGTTEHFKPNEQRKSDPSVNEVDMVCMSNVKMEKISWVWSKRIARGKVTAVAGDPGLGKSQAAIMIAATVTKGRDWPDICEPAPKGSVIFLSAEDDAADTIKPRLVAAEADVSRCHVLIAIRVKKDGKTGERTFDLSQDVDRLGAEIERIGDVALVIIDPISAYLGGDIDSHNNSDMRGLLAPLAAMAAHYNVAILLVTHLNKSKDQNMIARVIGSIALIAAARAGYVVVKDEKDPKIRYFVPIKNNIGNDRDGFAFSIVSVSLPEGIETSKIIWHEGLVDAHKILNPDPEKKPTATTGAAEFLQELLTGKPRLIKDIFDEAESGGGYSKPAIQRAARRLKVRRKKLGMDGGWEWSLPERASEDGDDAEDFTNF